MLDDNPEMQKNTDGSYTKYISMNKVNVNVAGSQDKLFVVRDLNSMVNLQKLMYTKKHFNYFTEKIVRQIQESSEVSLINLQKLDNHRDSSSPTRPSTKLNAFFIASLTSSRFITSQKARSRKLRPTSRLKTS